MGEHKIHIDHLGNKFKTLSEMLKHWNISYTVYAYRLENPKVWDSLEKILTTKAKASLKKSSNNALSSIDHEGVKYISHKLMCEKWGKLSSTVKYRLRAGWTLQEALETPNSNRSNCYVPERLMRVIGLNGIRYRTIGDMLKAFNIHEEVFERYSNINKGKFKFMLNEETDFSSIINEILSQNIPKEKSIKIKTPIDCYGVKFNTLEKFAKYLKINRGTLNFRLRVKRDTIEQVYDKYTCNVEVDGKIFTRVADLAKHFNINLYVLSYKREFGLSWEEIVLEEQELAKTSKLTGVGRDKIVDYIKQGETHESIRKIHCINYRAKGKIFYSLKELTKALNLNLETVAKSLRKNNNLEEVIYLSSPIEYDGKMYINHKKLVKEEGEVSYNRYVQKLRIGYHYEYALLTGALYE